MEAVQFSTVASSRQFSAASHSHSFSSLTRGQNQARKPPSSKLWTGSTTNSTTSLSSRNSFSREVWGWVNSKSVTSGRRGDRRGLVVRAEMFGQLTSGLEAAWNKLKGEEVLTKENIVEPMRDIRRALLEADVSLPVVRRFVQAVSEQAVGVGLIRGVKPDQQLVKVVRDELVKLMGGEVSELVFAKSGPTVILLAGLQGVGKTTVCAKLAYYLKKQGKSCMLVAGDVYRPAAIDQLVILGEQVNVPVYAAGTEVKPSEIAKQGLEEAKKKNIDVVIMDTAGRLQIDKGMMDELKEVKRALNPTEVLLVVDAMTGQEAAALVTTFNLEIGITGAILTKLDGDSRGGAALSVKEVSGKPIKLVGRRQHSHTQREKRKGFNFEHPNNTMDSLQATYRDEDEEEDDSTKPTPTQSSPLTLTTTTTTEFLPPPPPQNSNNATEPQNDTTAKPDSPSSDDKSPRRSTPTNDNTTTTENDNDTTTTTNDDVDDDADVDVDVDVDADADVEVDDDEEDPPPKKQKPLSSLTTTPQQQQQQQQPSQNDAVPIQTETLTLTPTPTPPLPTATAKKAKKKNNNVWVTKSTRKGKKKNNNNNHNSHNNNGSAAQASEDTVLITPIHKFPDKSDDTPELKICLSKIYKAEKVELTDDRLSAGSTKGYRMVRATRGVEEGSWYFEIKVVRLGETGHTRLGWSTEKGDLQAPVGYDGNSFGYRDIDGSKVHKALREKYGEEGYKEGDVIGFYINLPEGAAYAPKPHHLVLYKGQRYACAPPDAKEEPPKVVPGSEISFFKNGVCQGVAFKDLYGGRYYPAASMYTLPNQPNCVVKFNFGPDFEFFPEDFDGRPVPKPMVEVPYHGFENRVENGASSEKKH